MSFVSWKPKTLPKGFDSAYIQFRKAHYPGERDHYKFIASRPVWDWVVEGRDACLETLIAKAEAWCSGDTKGAEGFYAVSAP